ncbi:putative ribonuclease H-like domain-containing protein [Tanacetum coccineum]
MVAQGYTQEEGIDYDEFFAPVARINAIRLFLAYALFKDFVEYQTDVKSAFLYGKIEEEVYVYQPPGFEDLEFLDRVYKVEKALYGLHQPPRAWYETLLTYLLDNGFQRGKIDKTLFIRRDKGDILLVQVYVDDIIFGSTKKSLCTEFEKMMDKKFQISSMGELTFFLGLQQAHLWKLKKPLLKDEDGEEVDVYLYRSMISSLMYLTSSRPDIMFVVCACARYQVNPNLSHLHSVKRIFRYLKGQPKLGLWYPKDSPFDLVEYTNSDYAGASLDRKFTTGGLDYGKCRILSKPAESEGFEQIVDFLNANPIKYALTVNPTIYTSCIKQFWDTVKVKTVNEEVQFHTLVDRKKVIITESTIRRDLQLEDAEDSMVKFWMYPRFIQVFMNKQVGDMSRHKRIYVTPSHTKKIFRNMKREGKGFSGRVTPLFPTMMVQAQEEMGEGSANPTNPHHTPIITQPSTSQPQKKQKPRKPKRKDTEISQSSGPTEPIADEAVNEEYVPTHSNDPLLSGEDSLKLNDLMEICTKLQQRVLDLENTKTAKAQEISSLKLRVKRLEKKGGSRTHKLKILFKVGRSAGYIRAFAGEVWGYQMLRWVGGGDGGRVGEGRVGGGVVKNLDNAGKFLMYPRFIQVFLDNQLEGMSSHKRIYVTPSHTKKIFANMRRRPKEKDTQVPQSSVPSDPTNVADEDRGCIQTEEIDDSDKDAEITLVDETQGRHDDDIIFDVSDVAGEEVFVAEQGVLDSKKDDVVQVNTAITTVSTAGTIPISVATITEDEITLAQALEELKSVKPKVKVIMVEEPLKMKKTRINTALITRSTKINVDYQLAQRLQAQEQEELTIEEKAKLFQQSLGEKNVMKVILDEEEVAVDAIPLATKPPSIVDFKILKEGKTSYFQIIRADGSSKRYSAFIHMLRSFDREDLETLWKLVKAKHGYTRPKEDYERVL